MSSDVNLFDAGATIVDASKVDLRLPQAPPPMVYRGDSTEVIAAIFRYIGEGQIVSTAEPPPKYCVFTTLPDGRVIAADYAEIARCFAAYGAEACVFEYCLIEHRFIGRQADWFIPERIEKIT